MTRLFRRGLLAATLIGALAAPPRACQAQTRAEIDSLMATIENLQRMVAEQALRIAALETALRELELRLAPSSASPLNRPGQTPPAAARPPADEAPGWHNPENWWRIRMGMSYEEVVAILGQPTNIRGGYSLRTLQYQGEVPGSGFVQGEVGIYGDANRVFRIKRPEFGGG